MNLRKLFLIVAVVSPLIIFQGCNKDDDDNKPEIVNGNSTNDDKKTNDDNTNKGGETQTDLSELDWKVEWDYISDDFFPSWTYMQLNNNQFADAPECVSISIPKNQKEHELKSLLRGTSL